MQKLFTEGVITGFMFDTTVFNDILNNKFDTKTFPKDCDYFVTHIQFDELCSTKDSGRRKQLLSIFESIGEREIPTESVVLNVSRLGKAKLGDGKFLEELRKGNLKHTEDALIGETAIKNSLILVTDDDTLFKRVNKLGGEAIKLHDFLNGKYRQLKETEIGQIPKSWEVVRLEEMFDMQQGKAMSPKSRLGISPHPFLRTINILWGNVDLSILDHMDFTDEEMTKLCLQPDDLLVCEGGAIGRTAMWRGEIEDCGYQNHIHRLRKQRQDICPEFYMFWIQAAFLIFGLYAGEEIRTTIPNLSRGRLKSFLIPKPPLPEQKEIAHILSTVDKKIEVEEKRKATLRELFKTMLHKLMTGEIRVRDVEFKERINEAHNRKSRLRL
ncbi:unnamed protein product [marine sediment metagenome]|uniref:Type I restriction modification DNA specificity domain-containing protein n=1 Tax=marine sediment metagenome TaxID=412755 RepID=X1LX59_9ZZZZ